jgi:hypothetical protein
MPDQVKIDEFIAAYVELTKKYGMDFVSFPTFIPDEEGRFSIVIQTQAVEVKGNRIRENLPVED